MRKAFLSRPGWPNEDEEYYPSFLDPRTKILIWLLANVVVFTWSPAVFQLGVMVAYLILFLVERKGTMLAGLLATYLAILAIQYWLLPLLPGSLATVFATVTYFILVFPCIAGGAYLICHHQRQPVHGCFGEDGCSPEFFYYPCGDFALSACTSAGFASYLGCNESSKYPWL